MIAAVEEFDRVGAAYLARLTDADLRTLVRADQVGDSDAEARIRALRREPALVLDVLDRPATSAGLLNLAAEPHSDAVAARFTFVSQWLIFAAAIHRTAADLTSISYAPERTAHRLRVPVFDTAQLAHYLSAPRRRLFLVELLASFARVSSGTTVTRTPHGLRRRRWNDLDPYRLALLLDSAAESRRPRIWRRLGDLSLFLSGVFPDSAERNLPGRIDGAQLARLTGVEPMPADLAAAELLEWFGARWYRLAAARAAPLSAESRDTELLRDSAEHIHSARRVLNTAADRYLFPVTTDWFTPR